MADGCWNMNPDNRATFPQLKRTVNRFLVECKASPPVDLKCGVQQQARGTVHIHSNLYNVVYVYCFMYDYNYINGNSKEEVHTYVNCYDLRWYWFGY